MRRLLALVAVILAAPFVSAADLDLRDVFEETATAPTARYVLGRDLLLAAGTSAGELAAEYVDDADVRRRVLARYVRLQAARPEDCAEWSAAIRAPWSEITRDETDPRLARVRYTERGAVGRRSAAHDVRLSADAAWLLIDILRSDDDRSAGRAAQILGYLPTDEAAPFLAARLGSHWKPEEVRVYEDALVALGPSVLPHVRPKLEGEGAGGTETASAARVVGRLADAKSQDALLALVRSSEYGVCFSAATEALGVIAPRMAADAVIDRMLARISIHARVKHSNLRYDEIRAHCLQLGGAARDAISTRRGDADAPMAAVLDGVSWELADLERAERAYVRIAATSAVERNRWSFGRGAKPADVGRSSFWGRRRGGSVAPLPLLRERSVVARVDSTDFERLVREDGAAGVVLAATVLRGRFRRHGGAELFVALVEVAPEVALDVATEILVTPPGSDPSSASSHRLPADSARYVEGLFLAIDNARAGRLLGRIAARPIDGPSNRGSSDTVSIAGAALSVVHGTATLADLLGHADPRVALAAARALARRGDPAGVPVLAAAAIAERASRYVALRDDILNTATVPAPILNAAEFGPVLRAAIALRLSAPDRAAVMDRALAAAQPSTGSILGLQPADFEHAGDALARQLGLDARPILEEAALLIGDRVAVHAVGRLGHDDSIPVLLRVARRSPGAAAAALRVMGEKGLAAAKSVPPPDPEKADFGGRAGRHVAATDALSGVEGGIEKLLEGLAEAPPDGRRERDKWARRMAHYLQTARHGWVRASDPPLPTGVIGSDAPLDERLLEPSLALLAQHGARHTDLRDAAFNVLASFRDERVAVATLPYLPQSRTGPDGGVALAALIGSTGDRTTAFLRTRIDAALAAPRDARRLIHTLARLVTARATPLPRALNGTVTVADRDACAGYLRDACTSSDVAIDLLLVHMERPADERDARDLATVLHYVATAPNPGNIAYMLGARHPEGAGDALLISYRKAGDRQVLAALGQLGYEPAAPFVARAAKRSIIDHPNDRWRHAELGTLPMLGATGIERARLFLGADNPLATRVAAAAALARVGDALSFDDALALLDLVEIRENTDDPEHLFSTAVRAIATLDPARAHREFVRRMVTSPVPYRESYAQHALGLRRQHPEVATSLPATTD